MYDQIYLNVALGSIVVVVKRRYAPVELTAQHSDGPRLALMLAYLAISVRTAQAC
jgi:hypothetical protein